MSLRSKVILASLHFSNKAADAPAVRNRTQSDRESCRVLAQKLKRCQLMNARYPNTWSTWGTSTKRARNIYWLTKNQFSIMNYTYLSSFWTIQHENTTEKKEKNKTCTCVCQMCFVGSYNQVPETDEFAIAFISNHHVWCAQQPLPHLWYRVTDVCVFNEPAHCFFEKRGLYKNIDYYLFLFFCYKQKSCCWLIKLDFLDWQNMEKIIASTDRQDTDCDTNLKVTNCVQAHKPLLFTVPAGQADPAVPCR
jgi:hypothetical protein